MNNVLSHTVSKTPAAILDSLPQGAYTTHFQPRYSDTLLLHAVIGVLQAMDGVTTPRHIDSLRQHLSDVALGVSQQVVMIEGNCAEPVDRAVTIEQLAMDADARRVAIEQSPLGNRVLHIQRRVQSVKPRSAEKELVGEREIESYMGDAVNTADMHGRAPDPQRLLAMATQAVALESRLTQQWGRHPFAAHEALSLVYEHAMVRSDPITHKTYLISADLPWVGARTNRADGVHVAALQHIENPVGIKIGDSSIATHIRDLIEALNPKRIPGKLVFMLRLSPDNTAGLGEVLLAIKRQAPASVLLYDIHGVTRVHKGQKCRVVSDVVAQIKQLAEAAQAAGLKLHGLHLETMGDDSHVECVDTLDQLPTRGGSVDPALNPRQLRTVLAAVAVCFNAEGA